MQTQQQAEQARDAAMNRAEIGSGDHWQGAASDALIDFLDTLRIGDEFKTEDVRFWAYLMGLDEAKDNRAWGPVISRAAREKLIVKVGYAPAVTGHCRPMPVWSKA